VQAGAGAISAPQPAHQAASQAGTWPCSRRRLGKDEESKRKTKRKCRMMGEKREDGKGAHLSCRRRRRRRQHTCWARSSGRHGVPRTPGTCFPATDPVPAAAHLHKFKGWRCVSWIAAQHRKFGGGHEVTQTSRRRRSRLLSLRQLQGALWAVSSRQAGRQAGQDSMEPRLAVGSGRSPGGASLTAPGSMRIECRHFLALLPECRSKRVKEKSGRPWPAPTRSSHAEQ
jgi:hypothetical protein